MRLGEYEVTGEVGQGGMGVVLRGRGPDGADVAIKVLHRPERDAVARFERERDLLSTLGLAQGFVPLVGAGSSERGPFLVMPFVPGGTLRDRIDRGGPLPIEAVVALGKALGDALGQAHARGIVHRDLKPENVLYTAPGAGGRPLVADLGLAKHFLPASRAQVAGPASLSKTGEMRGTPHAMAPEQWTDSKTVGPRADVYAIGATLYEALTGRPAHDGESLVEVMSKVLAGRVEPVRALRPDCPGALAALVERCLALDPRDRPRNGFAVRQALEAAGPGERRPRGSRAALLAALALGVAALGGGAALAARATSDAPGSSALDAGPGGPGPGTTSPPGAPGPATTSPASAGGSGAQATSGAPGATTTAGAPGAPGPTTAQATSGAPGPTTAQATSGPPGATTAQATSGAPGPTTAQATSGAPGATTTAGAPATTSAEPATSGPRTAAASLVAPPWRGVAPPVGARLVATFGRASFLSMITGLDLSPDGRRALASSLDGRLRVWDVETWRDEVDLVTGRGACHSARFARDGRTIVAPSDDGVVRLRDAATGALLAELPGHTGAINDVALDERGRALTGGSDATLRLRELATGRELGVLTAADGVTSVAMSRDGTTGVAGLDRGDIEVWDLRAGRRRGLLSGHEHLVCRVVLSPDERRAYSAGKDGTLRAWDLERLAPLAEPPGKAAVAALEEDRALHHVRDLAMLDATHLVAGGDDFLARAWDLARMEPVGRFAGHAGWVSRLAADPARRRLVTGSNDLTVLEWDLTDPARPPARHGHEGGVVAVAERGGRPVSADAAGWLRTWDAATGVERARLGGPAAPAGELILPAQGAQALSLAPDGRLRAFALEGAAAPSSAVVRTLSAGAAAAALPGDGRLLVLDGGRPALAAGAGALEPLPVEGAVVAGCALGPGEVALALADGALEAWDTRALRRLERLPPGETGAGSVRGLAGASDGRLVLVAGADGLGLWERGGRARRLEGHAGAVRAVAISPDGRRALSCGDDDGTVRLWRLPDGSLGLVDLGPVPDAPTCIAFAQDAPAFLVGTARGGVLRFALDP